MKLITSVLTKDEIADLSKTYGDYVKITADIENKAVVVGVELHADAEAMLLEKGGKINDLWGGGINFVTKQIDATAVYNIRPILKNDSLEILDPTIRKKFIELVKLFFKNI
ncbi:hypothetical protein A2970_00110 [Candidatus Roizmanbacteria bacterium RIFCSPLOWO2_01_FULL_44_13]|uniref:Uncharacterized protein n=1 Tax=Candidatus Roizmanbacteria bacterium RIFCSPLOWO2_01_FULL_44_13 TaxID=1802069 RepID=A0A1F7JA29_9BACT|nr:MAG: hypothetical protein A2970_00110 [Candidatus Roizmanbacteria bacterium RIFCSPLOWO2_01_FULL_44_13]